MTSQELISLIDGRTDYNLHSHSEYCDGRAPMASIIQAAINEGFGIWGVTPHSPVPIESGCNMLKSDVPRYIDNLHLLREKHAGIIKLICGMEVDYLGRDFGPHIDYFQNMPLEYRIGSVHFVPNQDGKLLDCDGSNERFRKYLKAGYKGDLRYVVEKYFEQVLLMLESGGFEMLGHFDKIAGNASEVDPEIENQSWYEALIDDVISHAQTSGVIVEINTKSLDKKGRFFPAYKWWHKIIAAHIPIAVNSDCHYPDLTNAGRPEALEKYNSLSEQAGKGA